MSGRYAYDSAAFAEMATDAGTRDLIPDPGHVDDRPYDEPLEPRLCKDCKWAKVGTFVDCCNPVNMKPDLVVGGMVPRNSARYIREDGPCGVVGFLFEER